MTHYFYRKDGSLLAALDNLEILKGCFTHTWSLTEYPMKGGIRYIYTCSQCDRQEEDKWLGTYNEEN
jgi:hypothetical protein